jgi:CrcB protein
VLVPFAVALGAAAGAAVRHLCGLVATRLGRPGWVALLVANVGGSVIIGLGTATLADEVLRAGVLTGFCGALTTFSSFSLDNVLLAHGGQARASGFNAVASVVLGVLGCGAGLAIGAALS